MPTAPGEDRAPLAEEGKAESARFPSDGIAIARSAQRKRLLVALGVGGLGVALAVAGVRPALSEVALLAFAVQVALLARANRQRDRMPRGAEMLPGSIEIAAGLVVVERAGEKVASIPRSDIVDGWLESRTAPTDGAAAPLAVTGVTGDERASGPLTLFLRTSEDDLVAALVPDAESGHRLLADVGVSVSRRSFEARLASPASQMRFGIAAAAAGLVVVAAPTPLEVIWLLDLAYGKSPLAAAGLLVLAAQGYVAYRLAFALVAPHARIGMTGIAVTGLGRNVFVPLSDVASVQTTDRGLAVLRISGGALPLPLGRGSASGDIASALRALLAERDGREVEAPAEPAPGPDQEVA